jgi:tetratricopeptide (TPR) repeat protein
MNRFCVVSILLVLPAMAVEEATIREAKQVFPTYPFSGPDPAPIMTRSSMWGRGPRLYPYFFYDRLSYSPVDQSWNVVTLENPYIRVHVMPEEGGKLVGAVEKSTGKEFIYYNHVRKFRHIALRGPWTSGGIELNFGIVGHTPATASPVDYLVRKNSDGSVSCVVGNIDLPSRTQWRVTFTVPPDRAYVESSALWYNPQPLNQSYYVWMNAANRLSEDLEFVFPGVRYIGHDYSVPEDPWPMTADGRNLSRYKEHNDTDQGSYFIHGVLDEFMGSYWHNANFGFGHWALPQDMPGRKFFRWPLSRAGGIWESLLTDADGPYFEPQTGRLMDQNDHEFFAPYSVDQWRELWFPFKEIGGMVKATPYGALNVRNTGDGVSLGFSALQRIDDDLVVTAGGKQIHRERVALKPMEVYQKKLLTPVAAGTLEVRLGDKLSYTDNPKANLLRRPLNFREYEENTLEGLYQAAEREEKGRNYEAALEKYLLLLGKEPLHVRALTRVAELYARRAEYEKALEYAHKALDYVMYDPDANYIYGVIARRMGNRVDAKETFGWAARSMKYRSTANCQLGEVYLMDGEYDRAQEFLRRALEYDVRNIKALEVLSTLYRLRKDADQASKTLDRVLEIDPLNHLARFERYLLDPGTARLEQFRALIRNELPHETYLEIAMHYVNLGLDDDAARLLEVAPQHSESRYWSAYLTRGKAPEKSRELLRQASTLSPFLVFPFREESIPVFQWAAKELPGNWKASYYLALVYWGLNRRNEALAALDEAGDQPDYPTFYVSRAFLREETDPARTQKDYERAHAIDQQDWRSAYHLGSFYTRRKMHEQALKVASDAAKRFPGEDMIKILLARSYLNNGRYQDCYGILENATILPFEGQRDVHQLYVQCQVSLAISEMKQGRYQKSVEWLEKSKDFPERLGTGKPHNPDYRVQDYLLMLTHERAGEPEKARQAEQRIESYWGGEAKESTAGVKKKVEEWYSTELASHSEIEALRKLAQLLGPGRRGRD